MPLITQRFLYDTRRPVQSEKRSGWAIIKCRNAGVKEIGKPRGRKRRRREQGGFRNEEKYSARRVGGPNRGHAGGRTGPGESGRTGPEESGGRETEGREGDGRNEVQERAQKVNVNI